MKYIVSLVLALACLFNTNGQQCITFDELSSIFLKNNDEILNAERSLKIQYLTFRNSAAKWNLSSKVDLSLPYSKSIETVVAGDGSANFVEREYSNPLATISAVKRMPFTGGEIGVNSNIGLFKNFLKSGTQYSTNWFNVFINQPIAGFNEFRYEIALDKLDIHIDSIRFIKLREEKLRDFIEIVLDYELLKMRLNHIKADLNGKKNILQNSLILYDNGRLLATDTLIASYVLDKYALEIVQAELQLKEKKKQLDRLIKSEYQYSVCDLSNIRFYKLEPDLLRNIYVQFNQETGLDLDSFKVYQNEKRIAKNTGITTTFNAGLGANKTAMDFNQIFTTPTQRENFSLTTSIPITGWSVYKRNKQIASLEKEIFENKRILTLENAEIWSNAVTVQYSYLISSYNLSGKNIMIQDLIINKMQLNSSAGSINYSDYQRVLLESDNALLEQMQLIKDLQLIRYKIRSEVLYDIQSDRFLF